MLLSSIGLRCSRVQRPEFNSKTDKVTEADFRMSSLLQVRAVAVQCTAAPRISIWLSPSIAPGVPRHSAIVGRHNLGLDVTAKHIP